MAIRDRILTVIAQMGGENAEALKQELRSAITEAEELYEMRVQADNESKARKEKIRKLETELSEWKEKVEGFNNLNPELDRLRKIEADYLADRKAQYDNRLAEWNKKAEIFSIPETDKRHEKIIRAKDQFVFPADDKSALTDEQLAANLKAYSLLDMAGYFADEGGGGNPSPPRPAPTKTNDKTEKSAGQALWETMIKP